MSRGTPEQEHGVDKFAWTLARPRAVDIDVFRDRLLTAFPEQIARSVPSATEILVTVQDPSAYSGALVPVADEERVVDALLELQTAESYVPLDDVHELLRKECGHVQGWHVHSTLILDSTTPWDSGEPSPITGVIFVERLDGTSPEHFSRNWYIHAGHADGEEAPSEESLAERARDEAMMPNARYIQNRVLEPITPTAWVVHGYTQLMLGAAAPPLEDIAHYDNPRGEERFDRWPPRMLQGHEYRVR